MKDTKMIKKLAKISKYQGAKELDYVYIDDKKMFATNALILAEVVNHDEEQKDKEFINAKTLMQEDGERKLPSYEQLFKKVEDSRRMQVKLNPKLLIKLLEVFKDDEAVVIDITLSEGENKNPIKISSNDKRGLIMPII